jgi:hypothetical protein
MICGQTVALIVFATMAAPAKADACAEADDAAFLQVQKSDMAEKTNGGWIGCGPSSRCDDVAIDNGWWIHNFAFPRRENGATLMCKKNNSDHYDHLDCEKKDCDSCKEWLENNEAFGGKESYNYKSLTCKEWKEPCRECHGYLSNGYGLAGDDCAGKPTNQSAQCNA